MDKVWSLSEQNIHGNAEGEERSDAHLLTGNVVGTNNGVVLSKHIV